MDRIAIRGIRAFGKHGANPGERDREQAFDIDALIDIDLQAAERSDDLEATLDYDALHKRLTHIVATTSFKLLERLAGALLTAIFADSRVIRAELTIAKPEILNGATPSITLIRKNPRHRA